MTEVISRCQLLGFVRLPFSLPNIRVYRTGSVGAVLQWRK